MPQFAGTSPRAWGKLHDAIITDAEIIRAADARPSRFIALATSPHQSGSYDSKLHDWWHSVNSPAARRHSGTSPRAWGKQNPRHYGKFHIRNIPTRVGKTGESE